MRPILALLASAAIVSATGCAQNNIEDLIARISCGDSKKMSNCLRADIDLRKLDEVEQCLFAAGCSSADATVEAVWFKHDCEPVGGIAAELRRRQDTTADDTDTTTEKTTTKKSTTAKSTTAKSTTPASTEATTTQDSTTSETTTSASTTSDSTASSTTSTSASSATAASQTDSTTTPLVCSVTTTKSTSACSISGGKTLSCSPTTTLIASCAPGLICFSATAGADICMKKDDSLSTSGLIVTMAFGVGISAALIAWGIVAWKGKQKQKREEQAALLAAANRHGKRRDIEAASDMNLPLITGNTRNEGYNAGAQGQDYFGQRSQGGNSLTPPGNAPQLHQGLGALGQDGGRGY